MNRIMRNPARCYGCRVCQLACSLHHTGSFWPERSSIQVSRNPRTGLVTWTRDRTCDQCRREEEPFCVRCCSYEALKRVSGTNQEKGKRE